MDCPVGVTATVEMVGKCDGELVVTGERWEVVAEDSGRRIEA